MSENKLLIAVKSCQHDMERGDHTVIRHTWGRDVKDADLRFFFGGSPDEYFYDGVDVFVDAPDDYDSLTLKTIEIVRWAVEHNYDYAFLCDTDTFIVPFLLMRCGFKDFDYCGLETRGFGQTFVYSGRTRGGKDFVIHDCYAWCSGGYGFFLSRRAMELILAAPKPTDPILVWCEDMYVGRILGPHPEIRKAGLTNFRNRVSWHFPQSEYNSQYDPKFGWMERMYGR